MDEGQTEKKMLREKIRNLEKMLKKNSKLFSLCHPQATRECTQKKSAHSVQPFGQL